MGGVGDVRGTGGVKDIGGVGSTGSGPKLRDLCEELDEVTKELTEEAGCIRGGSVSKVWLIFVEIRNPARPQSPCHKREASIGPVTTARVK